MHLDYTSDLNTAERLKRMLAEGVVLTQSEAASVLGVTRQRISQICLKEGLVCRSSKRPKVKWLCPDCHKTIEVTQSQSRTRKSLYCRSCTSARLGRKKLGMAGNRRCQIEDCNRPHRARGWCYLHYTRWQRHGDPLDAGRSEPKRSTRYCDICSERHYAKGLCRNHYMYARRASVGS